MMRRMTSVWRTATLAVIALVTMTVAAQAVDGLYVSGGVGGTTQRWALGGNITYKFKTYTFSARGIMTDSNDKPTSMATDHTNDFALLVGYSSSYLSKGMSATIEGGISRVTISRVKYSIRHTAFGDVLSADDKSSVSTVGLAVQSQLYVWRVGLVLFGNLNREDNIFGALACFRFGKVN